MIKTGDQPGDGRLARSAFADETEGFAFRDVEADRPDRVEITPAGRKDRTGHLEPHAEVADLQERPFGLIVGAGLAQPMGGDVDLPGRRARLFDIIDHRKPLDANIRTGNCGNQALGIGVLGRAEHLGGLAVFDQLASIHHRHVVGDIRNDTHVVGDHQHGHMTLGAELFHQFQDLGLDRHVERGRRLVGDDEFRFRTQGERDHDPLAHTAGKLVRILLDPFRRIGNADRVDQFDGSSPGLVPGQRQMGADGFHQLGFHRLERIERGERILKDHADLPAAQQPFLLFRQAVDPLAVEIDLAFGYATGFGEEADHRIADGGLAGTAFADDAEDLAGFQGQIDALHRNECGFAARKLDLEIADLKNAHGLTAVSG